MHIDFTIEFNNKKLKFDNILMEWIAKQGYSVKITSTPEVTDKKIIIKSRAEFKCIKNTMNMSKLTYLNMYQYLVSRISLKKEVNNKN